MKLSSAFAQLGLQKLVLHTAVTMQLAGPGGLLLQQTFRLLHMVWPITKCQPPSAKDVAMCAVMKGEYRANSCRAHSSRWISSCCSFKEEKQPRVRAQLM